MHWRDTSLLAPAGKKALAELGKFCGIHKVELPPGMITRMRDLRMQDPRLFAKYAITDCRVTMTYFCRYVNQYAALFPGVERVPYTITGSSIAGYLQFLEDDGTMSREQVFGLRPSLRKQSKPTRRYLDQRAFTESFARDCYHGAANFAAVHGHRNCTIWDIDFKSAYPAVACTIPAIDWSVPGIDDPDYELRFDGVPTFVEVVFEFSASCVFPCIPVPDIDYGLIYPRTGHAMCTGIEVALAKRLGAKLIVKRLHRFRSARDMAFLPFMSMLMRERAKTEPDTLANVLLKEMANSFYGGLGQGLGDTTLTDLRGVTKPMPASKVSCPAYAATITGIVRAVALAVANAVTGMPGYEVLSATTDGLMLVVPDDCEWSAFMRELQAHPACALLARGVKSAGLGDGWLELKKAGRASLTIKTRGNILDGRAKFTGIKLPGGEAGAAELLAYWNSPDIHTRTDTRLAKMREIVAGRFPDLIEVAETKRVNVDFDYKRVIIDDEGHTRPPETIEEVRRLRRSAAMVRRRGHRATPTAVELNKAGVSLRGGQETAIKRYIHRAVAHNLGGWRPAKMKDVATSKRLGITPDVFKQYKRRRMTPQKLPDTQLVRAIVQKVARQLGLSVTEARLTALLAPARPDTKQAAEKGGDFGVIT